MVDMGNLYTNGIGAAMFHSAESAPELMPAPECNSHTHIAMVFVTTIIFVPFLAGFVITQYKATHKQGEPRSPLAPCYFSSVVNLLTPATCRTC